MNTINEILGRTPDRPLFHYTTASGLLGILSENAMWASSAYHLNDAEEFRYAVDLIRERIRFRLEHENGPSNSYYGGLLTILKPAFDDLQVFIASLSEEGDLLSQWLSYSGVNGYALEVGTESIGVAVADGFTLVRCVYSREEQVRIADAFIDVFYDYDSYPEPDSAIKAVIVAASIKHPGFEREAEWRLVKTVPVGLHDEQLYFRSGRNGIVPYMKARLSSDNASYMPARIYIGPNADMQAAKTSLNTLFSYRKKGNLASKNVDIIPSKTPYRP